MIEVRTAAPREIDTCLAIRHEVFVLGQGVPPGIEVDGLDPRCTHFLAFDRHQTVGTARLRITPEGAAKAERVAVRPGWRGRGIGVALMAALEEEARSKGHHEVVLYAQQDAIPFYDKLGYLGVGERFVEAGIVHLKMVKGLR